MKKKSNLIISLFALSLTFTSINPQKPFWKLSKSNAKKILSQMSLKEKVGQLYTVGAFSYDNEIDKCAIEKLITKYHIGGLMFMYGSLQKQIELTNHYQNISKLPLLISQDCEVGLNMRLPDIINFPFNVTLGAIQNNTLIYELGQEIAKQCKLSGVHVNFAPVVDINKIAQNPITNDRAYSENKKNVAKKGVAFMKGLQDAGVIACAKHFPGHANTYLDSHIKLPVIEQTLQELKNVDLYPFAKTFNAGIMSAMIAHLHIPKIDSTSNLSSSLSPIIIKDILKKQMKYKGLVFTDALKMHAITNHFTASETTLRALHAGNDILVFADSVPDTKTMLKDISKSVEAVLQAIKIGLFSKKEIDKKVLKILMAKEWLNLFENKLVEPTINLEEINSEYAEELKAQLFEEAITVVKNKNKLLPLKNPETKIAYVSNLIDEENNQFLNTLKSSLDVTAYSVQKVLCRIVNYKFLTDKFSNYDVVIFDTRALTKQSLKLLNKLIEADQKVVLIIFDTPYTLGLFGDEDAIVVAYEDEPQAEIAAAKVVSGKQKPKGKLPITATEKFREGLGLSF